MANVFLVILRVVFIFIFIFLGTFLAVVESRVLLLRHHHGLDRPSWVGEEIIHNSSTLAACRRYYREFVCVAF
jgi:hypothetical protein